jgi:hypothetical protein
MTRFSVRFKSAGGTVVVVDGGIVVVVVVRHHRLLGALSQSGLASAATPTIRRRAIRPATRFIGQAVEIPSDPNTETDTSVALRVHTTESPVDIVNRGVSNVSSNGISVLIIMDTSGAEVEVDTNIRTNTFAAVERLVITAQAITPSVVPFV